MAALLGKTCASSVRLEPWCLCPKGTNMQCAGRTWSVTKKGCMLLFSGSPLILVSEAHSHASEINQIGRISLSPTPSHRMTILTSIESQRCHNQGGCIHISLLVLGLLISVKMRCRPAC